MAVGLGQAAIAFFLLAQCARVRTRRRRARRELALLQSGRRDARQLSPARARTLVEGVGELATETHPGFRSAGPPAAAAHALRPAVVDLLSRIRPDGSATRTQRAWAGGITLLRLAPHPAGLSLLDAALSSRQGALVPLAAVALGEGASQYPGSTTALAEALRSATGAGALTMAWALQEALRGDAPRAARLARDPSPLVRRCALRSARPAAGAPPADLARLAFVQDAVRDRDPLVRAAACRTLAELPPEVGIAPLAGALQDRSADVAQAAAEALGALGTRAAATVLVQCLPTASAGLAGHVLRALRGVKGALPSEAGAWLSSGDARLTAIGLECAAAMAGAEVAWPIVVGLLGDPVPGVRAEAARACGAFARRLAPGNERSAIIEGLLAALASEQDVPALGAIGDALAASGDAAGVPSLLARMAGLDRPGRERLLEAVALGELVASRQGAR